MDYDTSKEAINLEIVMLQNAGNTHLANILISMLAELESFREAEEFRAEYEAGMDF